VSFSLDLSIDVLRRSPATLEAIEYLPVLTDHEVPRS
jgi:hypothetical protein